MNGPQTTPTPRLTSLAHGGGCGCKIAPAVLSEILSKMPPGLLPKELMVGTETSDDAAVWRLNDQQALVATTDFFMPVVDDPTDFGKIAATNAISDIYAMGARPIFALALVGMPVNVLPPETVGAILRGGHDVCQAAGIPIAGGHTIDSVEPIYGLVVLGLAHPDHIRRNRDAREGDVLILGKGLGVGIYSAAFKKEALAPELYREMIASTTKLNTVGAALGADPAVHALTDITGFGLAGHVLEIARGSNLDARISLASLPVLPGVHELIGRGFFTGASDRNWASYGSSVQMAEGLGDQTRILLTDPQTSGGLLACVAPQAADRVLAMFNAAGFSRAAVVGKMAPMESKRPMVRIDA
ncbi:MAG: selenide, water dikinase SelD [Burkholderiaceae bacterium]|nr:selenide, water dikinase SelD [Burkholderiaceae bacterium]